MLIITAGDTKAETEDAYDPMIFDIECVVERKIIAGQETFEGEAEQKQRTDALIQLLKSWREGDEEEQRDTLEYLQRALDEGL